MSGFESWQNNLVTKDYMSGKGESCGWLNFKADKKHFMENNSTRRSFIGDVIKISSGIVLVPAITQAQDKPPVPALDAAVVKEFVKVAHSDLNKIKEMLAQYPHLLNASWDWGDGDFETAIGAAGHMGLKDTANFLIENGARYDIFVMTMLGKTAQVKTMVEENPKLIDCIGPHGFTLLHHAKQGGKEAAELFAYFDSKGLKDTFRKTFKR
jgi:hypothetical protein